MIVRVERRKEKIVVLNPVTGPMADGAELLAKAPLSLRWLRNRSFKDIVSQVELYVAELLRLWLSDKPALISEKALSVATLLACRTLKEARVAAIREAVESTVADKMFGRPDKWFHYVHRVIGARFAEQDVSSFIEMKARRDVLEHHAGVVEATYQEKAKAGAKYKAGVLIVLTDRDVDEAYELTRSLIQSTAAGAMATLAAAP